MRPGPRRRQIYSERWLRRRVAEEVVVLLVHEGRSSLILEEELLLLHNMGGGHLGQARVVGAVVAGVAK